MKVLLTRNLKGQFMSPQGKVVLSAFDAKRFGVQNHDQVHLCVARGRAINNCEVWVETNGYDKFWGSYKLDGDKNHLMMPALYDICINSGLRLCNPGSNMRMAIKCMPVFKALEL